MLVVDTTHAPSPWSWGRMVENYRNKDPLWWVAPACALVTVAFIGAHDIFGSGIFGGRGIAEIQGLQQQVASMEAQVQRLADRVDQGPRADQLQDIIRHLSSQDGRIDSFDTRLRTLESDEAAVKARMDGIDAASKAILGGRR